MGLTSVSSRGLTGEPGQQDVREELDRIVMSRVFRGSHRCQSFLQYVVAKTLEGDAKHLKERTLAVHVFGREATEDLSDDSIVRVGAREVRKRLAQYYVDEGAKDPVKIDLAAGSYIPSFQWCAPTATIESDVALPQEQASPAPQPPSRRIRLDRKVWVLTACLLLACLAVVAWRALSGPPSAFLTFWQPAFAEKTPLLIAIAHPIVYQPSLRAQRLDASRNEDSGAPAQHPLHVPPALLNGSDFVPAINQYVGFGDADAALRLSLLFAQHHAGAHVRLASRTDFNDLRGSGTVLIGAYTNRWTLDLTKNMRYHFNYDSEGKPCIAEAAAGCRWTLTTKADDGRSAEDYILICRLPHSPTGSFTVICAGLNVYGTEEAGRIISDPDSLTPILRALPKHWADHNLQIVLHVAVIGDAPAQSELVSAYSW